ncbi:DNA/RNA nuclease SfsA [Merismopedia glauca]|uniref:Sugar fermentation stimulation protein homolog n=1 Tax=Merismopedia glauca CCAP 1448/3 TaxID=1296344 RepID=A0A2T1C0R6_9CYAN|nr:DNA/RNA nuclease SfsA [Merismopedia glauca]PSB01832.1 DNA/RNA nuclease SfsA [Merismopedia glauca CCAP 1448/3]
MNNHYIYSYPQLYFGRLIQRYKRFLADIELDSGEVITAHCANTGPMLGVSTPNSRVAVSLSDNKNRKLPYTWELIQVNDLEPTWVGINTGLPNKIIKIALEKRLFPSLGNYQEIRPEVAYGKDKGSRIDFFLTGGEYPIYLEVKNTTWSDGKIALFPDTVTTRGQKHLQELMDVLPEARSLMLYLINRGDCTHFAPGDRADPLYGKLLRQAMSQGVEILPCRFAVTPEGVRFIGLAEHFSGELVSKAIDQ